MSVSSNSSSGSRYNHQHIFENINEHMFNSENLHRWTRFITETPVNTNIKRKHKERVEKTTPTKQHPQIIFGDQDHVINYFGQCMLFVMVLVSLNAIKISYLKQKQISNMGVYLRFVM